MPVMVFYGDDDFLLEQAIGQLRKRLVNPSLAGLCHRVYRTPSLAMVLEAVGSVSLALGGDTLIEIKDFALLHQAVKDTGTEAQLEELKSLLAGVEPSKTVAFISQKVDGKIKFAKWITHQPDFQIQKFEKLKFWESQKAVDFLCQYAQTHGIALAPPAAEALVESVGCDLRCLVNELEKLALYAHQRTILPDDVQLLSAQSDNLFQVVQRWILQEAPDKNFQELSEILLRRHSIEVLATVQGYFSGLFRCAWLASQGLSPDRIAQRLGQKPFTVKKNLAQFRLVSPQRWRHLKRKLTTLEWQIKTGQLSGPLALEVLLGT